jgi:hypothetical protein
MLLRPGDGGEACGSRASGLEAWRKWDHVREIERTLGFVADRTGF